MAATLYFLLGLAAIVAAVYGLAGPWWGLLVAGTVLVALGVLTARGELTDRSQRAGDRR